jgi:formylglycine-generating enzyme required for sulfatase activity
MAALAKSIVPAMIILIFIVSCGETEQESVYVSPTATLRPPTSTPVPPTATATGTSTPPPTATPTNTSTPVPTHTSTPMPTETRTATPTFAPPAIQFPDHLPELGDTLTRPIDDMVMVYVPCGTFEMGSLPDDSQFGPHTVTLDGFWIDQTEVTNAQYAAFLNQQGNQVEEGWTWLEVQQLEAEIEQAGSVFQPKPGRADHPVIEVSWNGSHAYCQWVGGRLPTEAEWEYAARGPENYIYPWGNGDPTCNLSQLGGCGDTSVPVGSLSDEGASWIGARDMAGNVWEWVADWYGKYPSEAQTNPTGPNAGERKVARGGSFMSAPDTLHTAYRWTHPRMYSVPNVGFRCAASVPDTTSSCLATPSP